MSLHATVWRMAAPSGAALECEIRERDGRWLVFVRKGKTLTLSARCGSDDAALQRAHQIWEAMKRHGYREATH